MLGSIGWAIFYMFLMFCFPFMVAVVILLTNEYIFGGKEVDIFDLIGYATIIFFIVWILIEKRVT